MREVSNTFRNLSLSCIFSFLALTPIYLVIPTLRSELKLNDTKNYVLLIMNEKGGNWAYFFKKISLFILNIFQPITPFKILVYLKVIRYISIFMITFVISYLILEKLSPIKGIILSFAFALSYPEKYLLYLFRIRLLFGIGIFFLGYLLYFIRNFDNKIERRILIVFSYLLIILSSLIHEVMIIPTCTFFIIQLLLKFENTKNLIFSNLNTTYFIILFLLIFPIISDPIFSLINLKLHFIPYKFSINPRGFPFAHYYYICIIGVVLIHIIVKKYFNKHESKYYLVNNILRNLSNPLFITLLIITFLLKVPLYIDSVIEILFITVLWIYFSILKINLNIRESIDEKLFKTSLVIILFLQIISILMQYWQLSSLGITLENQFDVLANMFYPLTIVYINTPKPNFVIDNIKISKLSISTNLLNNIDYNKILIVIFLILILETPSFIISEGNTKLPIETTYKAHQLDTISIEMIKMYAEARNVTDYHFGDSIPNWRLAACNGQPLLNRLISLTGYPIMDHEEINHTINSGKWRAKLNLNLTEAGGIWIFYIFPDPLFYNFTSMLTHYNYRNYTIEPQGHIYQLISLK